MDIVADTKHLFLLLGYKDIKFSTKGSSLERFHISLHTNSEYGICIQKTKNVEVNNVISKKDLNKYLHLDLKGEIIIRKDNESCFAEIELNFENYFPVFVRVWPNNYNARFISPAESDISFEEIVFNSKSL